MKPLLLRLLGPMELLVDGKPLPTLPAQKGRWLMALLALRDGAAVERSWLAETLWPDSFGPKARYNLRRCLTDLRDALGEQATRIESFSRETLRMNLDGVTVDVVEFDRLTSLSSSANSSREEAWTVQCLERALALYRGPFLEGWTDDWVHEARVQRQEALLAALETLADFAAARRDYAAACGFLRRAVALDPARETAQRALMQALADAGDTAAVVQEYRKLRLFLRDTLATEPSRATRALFQRLSDTAAQSDIPIPGVPPPRHAPSRTPDPAGGALPPDSPLYIERAADSAVDLALRRGDGILLIKGPHQIGKSSLLARAAAGLRTDQRRVAITDVAALGADALRSYAAFAEALGNNVVQQIGPVGQSGTDTSSSDPPRLTVAGAAPGNALERFVTQHALSPDKGGLVWILDEVDTAFGAPFRDEIFALFRAWYNARALSPGSAWRRLTLILTYATEAHLLIGDVNQSPFNVGTRVTLRDFTLTQTAEANRRYGLPLTDDGVQRLWALLRGHPFLTQCALGALAARETDLETLERTARQDDETLFSSHLRRMCAPLLRDRVLEDAVYRVILDATAPTGPDTEAETMDPEVFYRLRSAGILAGSTVAEAHCRCPLYATYLSRLLKRRRRENGGAP